jgi:hypothetical protein
MKNPNDPSGIKPATFWLAEQYLNQLHHRVPYIFTDCLIFFLKESKIGIQLPGVWSLERELNVFPDE